MQLRLFLFFLKEEAIVSKSNGMIFRLCINFSPAPFSYLNFWLFLVTYHRLQIENVGESFEDNIKLMQEINSIDSIDCEVLNHRCHNQDRKDHGRVYEY